MSERFFVLESGARVKVKPVPAFLLEKVQSRIPYPRIPLWVDENGAEWENPGDPDYVAQRQAVEAQRISVAMMAAIVYGVELIDENGDTLSPPDDGWEKKLRFLGIDWRQPLDGTKLNPSDEGDMEFAKTASYLLYWLMTPTDIAKLMEEITAAGGAATKVAEDSFQGNTARRTNKGVSPKRN